MAPLFSSEEEKVRKAQAARAGQVYEGPACWCDDYQAVPRPGYYALSNDGRNILRDYPLVCVDDAPGDPENGACHYEYAGPDDNPYRSHPDPASVVSIEAHDAAGKSSTEI